MTAQHIDAPELLSVDADVKRVERLRARFDGYMKEKGMRASSKRRLIVDWFLATAGHLTVEELLQHVSRVDARVAYATVYRTLKLLTQAGIAEERRFLDGTTRYEVSGEGSHHDHLICLECGRIQEFHEPLIEDLQGRVAERFGVSLLHHRHELYGVCSLHRTLTNSNEQ